ncbi:MAG: hypothetical protein B5766_10035 [Candidatus Lumbricidophila eiseniae]|uniref:CobQ/CobB/MinD/ParA nucleotide binding domain-containing protein n=1 Tax=Candidatus Lumbricidiphila eiseniae TaxID=1969409 RepID=A0A2A6FPI9_9MICO|nr:MAG: hypothetical protein B5766_10035 [Candidatus Lumbricidophila eiseniae]
MVSGGTRQGGVATDGGNPGGGCRCNTNHRQGATTDGGNLVTRLMFAPDDELMVSLARVARERGHTVCAVVADETAVRENLDLVAPEVVVVRSERGALNAAVLAECDDRGIRTVGLVTSATGAEHAASLGLREVVEVALRQSTRWRSTGAEPDPLSESEWVALAARLQPVSLPRAIPLVGSTGCLVVWGPPGAPGRTTVAINLAAELAAAGQRVALVEADPDGNGTIARVLGLAVDYGGFAEAYRRAIQLVTMTRGTLDASPSAPAGGTGETQVPLRETALDVATWRTLTQEFPSPGGSLVVLSGTTHTGGRIDTAAVGAVLAGARADADCLVVDVGSALAIGNTGLDSRGVLARRCLAAADRIVVVGAADPVGLERVREGAAALRMLAAPTSIDVFVNRVRPRVLGRRPQEHLRTALRGIGGRSVYRLPNDASATDAALAAAAPLRVVAPRSALRRAIRDYALSLLVR